MSFINNYKHIKDSLPANCKLIAVSKTHPVELIREAYDSGIRIFGENKVQELAAKYEALPKDIEWHLIGHLQRNKVKYIAPFVSLIHSVDSPALLKEIDKEASKNKRVISVLLQIYIAEEETKFGLSFAEASTLLNSEELKNLKHIIVKGLMGMATNTTDEVQIRLEFKKLKLFFDSLKGSPQANVQLEELSMGMSSDYKIAAEEGSTMVRIGSAIFGQRNYTNNE